MEHYNKVKFGYDLKEETSNKKYTVRLEKNITVQELEDIIVGSFEGGSSYWLGVDNREWTEKPEDMPVAQYALSLLLDKKTVKLYNIEDDERYELTTGKLLKGIARNIQKRPWDCDLKKADAITYDCIIQFALFGEVVYG